MTELRRGGGGKSFFALRKQCSALKDETLALQFPMSSQAEPRREQQDRWGVLLSRKTKCLCSAEEKQKEGREKGGMLLRMGNYSVIFFIRKITHPGTRLSRSG